MKYLKLFESFEYLHEICKLLGIENYTINSDGSIDLCSDISFYDKKLKKIPIKFNISCGFDCSNNKLTSFEGSPKEVNGNFLCYQNELTSFKFAPKIIRGMFDCDFNDINSFEYFPSFVKQFICDDNPIFEVWKLFGDTTKIELLNDFDIFRDEDTETPSIVIDRLNDFLITIGKPEVEKVDLYKNI